jgi:hypothetical protein
LANQRFTAKKEISVRAMLTMLSEALALPPLSDEATERNVEFEAILPDVRIDCLLLLTDEEVNQVESGALKELGTINVVHIKAIGDRFTLEHLQTYLGQALILNSSTQTKPTDRIFLLVICSESFPQVLNGQIFKFVPKPGEPWVYMNKVDWFFPVRILVLNEIHLTDENLAIYFPFVPFISDKEKFLEFFPKIATLEIPDLWKLYCDMFAQKTNPHYAEVRKMILQLTPDDALKAIQYVSDDVPETINKIVSLIPADQRLRTIDLLLPHISADQRLRTIDLLLPHISADQRLRTIDLLLPHISADQRLRTIDLLLPHIPENQRREVFNTITRQMPEEQLKEWAREILNGNNGVESS